MTAVSAPEAFDIDRVVGELEADGASVLPGVLDPDQVAHVLERLWAASEEWQRRGMPSHMPQLDPNAANVRVFDLVDIDQTFRDLLEHPVADAVLQRFLGAAYIVSNFTANIARPGSGSMFVHSDQSLVAPEPWSQAWACNAIWCLHDIRFENGATLHIPGSHRWERRSDVPADPMPYMVPFEAPAGSIVFMEGRVWHTSGANITADEDRALLFGYFTRPFVRPQWNWSAAVRPEVQHSVSPNLRYRLGLDVAHNLGLV